MDETEAYFVISERQLEASCGPSEVGMLKHDEAIIPVERTEIDGDEFWTEIHGPTTFHAVSSGPATVSFYPADGGAPVEIATVGPGIAEGTTGTLRIINPDADPIDYPVRVAPALTVNEDGDVVTDEGVKLFTLKFDQ